MKSLNVPVAVLLAGVMIGGAVIYSRRMQEQPPQIDAQALGEAVAARVQETMPSTSDITTQVAQAVRDELSESTAAPEVEETPILNEEKLARKVADRVMARLRKNDFLARQFEKGIKRLEKARVEARRQQIAEQQKLANEKAKGVRRPSAETDHIRGNPDAGISLIEYSDFECPYCKRFHEIPKALLAEYPQQLNWVYRHFPLPMHNPGATKEAEAAECAAELGGSEAFWSYADAIYQRTKSGGKGFPLTDLGPLAKEIGLDQASFDACLNSGKFRRRIREDLEEGSSIGVSGTPATVLINTKSGEVRFISGAQKPSVLKSAIKDLLGGADQENKDTATPEG